MTIKEALGVFSAQLSGTDAPVREARLLIGLETGMSMSEVILNESLRLRDDTIKEIEKKVKRRAMGEPFAYISGEKEFMGYSFKVSPAVLIPRDETEFLVQEAEKHLGKQKGRVLDLCTGSGCVAISLAKRMPEAELTAVDVSEEALLIAEENAKRLNVKVNFIQKDILKNKIRFGEKFSVAVSNPPYIETETISGLEKGVKDYEPILALDGGGDGLAFYRRIVEEAENFLDEGGRLCFEIGYNQAKAVVDIMEKKFKDIEVARDYAGHPRVVAGTLSAKETHGHYGHRQRLRERFIAEGLESFQNHEKLELLLGYAIPRRNVNEIAHRLIKKFGGFSKVMDASVEDLVNRGGITENTAMLITMIPHFSKAYRMDKWKSKPNLANTYVAGKFAVELFVGSNYEEAYIICLDNMGGYLNHEKIAEGTINETPFYPRLVIEAAIRNRANKVIIAHNHPSGVPEPSWSDKMITSKLKAALENIDIELADHIIVGGEQFVSMKDSGLISE